jgi:hypothetical protein
MASKSLEFLPHWMPVMPSSAAKAGKAKIAAVTMLKNSACRFIETLLRFRRTPSRLVPVRTIRFDHSRRVSSEYQP